MNHNKWLGGLGEQMALQYLKIQGLEPLECNWRPGNAGEVDLVMRDQDVLVFVEVKTRHRYLPTDAVDAKKLGQLVRLVNLWFREHQTWTSYRIDMVGIGIGPDDAAIKWWKGIDR